MKTSTLVLASGRPPALTTPLTAYFGDGSERGIAVGIGEVTTGACHMQSARPTAVAPGDDVAAASDGVAAASASLEPLIGSRATRSIWPMASAPMRKAADATS